jgi:F-type H+-transporting ATPase subunit epsilon
VAEDITLRVITPDEIVLDTTAESVRVPGVDGSLGILRRHASMVTALEAGDLSYTQNGREEHLFIGEGFAEVRDNTIRVVADASERPTDIDVERATKSAERARERLKSRQADGPSDFDALRAQAALRRAMQRLRMSNRN